MIRLEGQKTKTILISLVIFIGLVSAIAYGVSGEVAPSSSTPNAEVSITNPTDGDTVGNEVNLKWSASCSDDYDDEMQSIKVNGDEVAQPKDGVRSYSLNLIDGTYDIEVNVQFYKGEPIGSGSDKISITVNEPSPPNADAGGPYGGYVDTSISLDGSGSSDNGEIVSYEWDLDNDGNYDDASGSTTSKTWQSTGSYTIGLKATDDCDETDTDHTTVYVDDGTSPSADPGGPYSGDEDTSISFDGTGSSDNVAIKSYHWDWTNDGNYETTGKQPSHEYSQPGDYTVKLKVTDYVGETDTATTTVDVYDVTAPTADPGGPYSGDEDTSISFDGSGSTDNVGIDSYLWDLDNDGYYDDASGSTASKSWSDPGTYTIWLKVKDAAGNTDTGSAEVTVNDVTDPTVSIDTPNDGSLHNKSDVTIEWSGNDNVKIDHYEVKLGSNAYSIETSPCTFTNLSDGSHTLYVKAVDTSGNSATDSITITVDTTAPTVSIDAPNDGSTHDINDITLEWSGGDNINIDHYEVKYDSNDYHTETSSYTFSGLSDGSHTLYVKAVDTSGNTAEDSITVTVDTTAPSVSIDTPGDGSLHNKSDVTVEWSGSDNVDIDHYEVKYDSNDYHTETSPYVFDALSDGSHNLYVKAVDIAGNNVNDSITITVDTTAPNADAGGPYSGNAGTSLSFNGTGSNDNQGIASWEWDWTSDGNYEGSGETPTHEYSEPGIYTVELKVTDLAGNTDTDTAEVEVEDMTPPTVNITSHEDNSILDRDNLSLEWVGDDNEAIDHYEVKQYSDNYTTVGKNESYEFKNLTDGKHILYVKAVDGWNNEAIDNITVTVDTVKPDIEVISPVDEDVYSSDHVQINWSSSNNATELGIAADQIRFGVGSDWENVSSTKRDYENLSDDHYVVYLRAVDGAGNTATKNVNFTIDTTSPTIEIESPSENSYLGNNSVKLEWKASDNTTGMRYRMKVNESGEGWKNVSYPSNTLNLTDGHYKIFIKAIDEANNEAETNVTFTVDTETPSLSVTDPLNGEIFSSGSVEVKWNSTDIISGLKENYLKVNGEIEYNGPNESYQLTELNDGKKELKIISSDRAGNRVERKIEITIDTTPPDICIDSPKENETIGGNSITVSWRSWNNETHLKVSSHKVYLNGEEIVDIENKEYTLGNLSDGEHTLKVIAKDEAGNRGSDTITFSVSSASLEVDITSPKDGALSDKDTVKVRWNITLGEYDLDRSELFLDGELKYNGSEEEYLVEDLSDGEHEALLKIYDNGGNSQSETISFTVDTSPPRLEITSPENHEEFYDNDVEIDWESKENTTKIDFYKLKIDQKDWIKMENDTRYEYSSLEVGEHSIELIAVDEAGNTVTESVTFEVLEEQVLEKVEVNDGDQKTENREVSIDVVLKEETYEVDQIRIALNREFTRNSTGWIDYEENLTYDLPFESGNYTVYLEVKVERGIKSKTVGKEVYYDKDTGGETGNGDKEKGEIDLNYNGLNAIIFEENLNYELQWNNSGDRDVDRYKLIANSSKRESELVISNLVEKNFTYEFEDGETVYFELIALDNSGSNESIDFEVNVDLIDTAKLEKDWASSENEELSINIPESREDDVSVIWYINGEAESTGLEFEPDLEPGEYNVTAEITTGAGEVKKSKEYNVEVKSESEKGFPNTYLITAVGLIAGFAALGAVVMKKRASKSSKQGSTIKTGEDDHPISKSGISGSKSGSGKVEESGEINTSQTSSSESEKQLGSARSDKSGSTPKISKGSEDSSVDISDAVKKTFEELKEATENEAHHYLSNEKGIQIPFDEFEKEVQKLVKEEKLSMQPQRSSPDLYKWNKK